MYYVVKGKRKKLSLTRSSSSGDYPSWFGKLSRPILYKEHCKIRLCFVRWRRGIMVR